MKAGEQAVLFWITVLIVIAMVGVSLPSLFWLYSLRPENPVEYVEVTREVIVTAVATAVPTDESEVEATTTPNAASVETINRIAYINGAGQIMTINPNGSDAQQVTKSIQDFQYPAWSPDSTQLAVIGQDGAGGAVYVVDADAEEAIPENLYSHARESPFYLYWSPSGRSNKLYC